MRTARRVSTQQGFTLVEIMIVVTIVGILASLSLPSIVNVMHRTKLTETMAQMRTVAHAWDAQAGTLLQDEFYFKGDAITVSSDFPHLVTAQELENLLEMDVPEFDSWGNRFEYRVDEFPSSSLLIRSANSDGEFEDEIFAGTEFGYANRLMDLVWTVSAVDLVRPSLRLQGDEVSIPTRETNTPGFVRNTTGSGGF